MFRGWMQYGDTEVVNAARAHHYAENGIAVEGLKVLDCTDCHDIAEVLGDDAYDSPLQDRPPWLDDGNPDSADFAGIMVMDVSGLTGSTIVAPVTERIGDGGIVGSRRAASRTISVSALAIARTEAGLDAGLSWLASALHPPCTAGECRGDVLHLFSACPIACEGQTDPNATPVTTDYTNSPEFTGGYVGHTAPIRNVAYNGSFEIGTATTVDGWGGNNVFGSVSLPQAVGIIPCVSVPAVAGCKDRANVARVTWGNQTVGTTQNFVHSMPDAVVGQKYLMSAWVWVPSGAPNIRPCSIFQAHGQAPYMNAKDRWVYVQTIIVANSTTLWYGFETDPATPPTAGQVMYVDAVTLVVDGGLSKSVSFESANTEGWRHLSALGYVAPPSSISTTASTVTGADGQPTKTLFVAWSSAPYTGLQSSQGVFVQAEGLTVGRPYTFTCQVWNDGPDIRADYLFASGGAPITAKGTWTPVSFTFVPYVSNPEIGFQTVGGVVPAAGTVMYVDNPRIAPGYGTLPPYFDGATADTAAYDFSWVGAVNTSASLATPKAPTADDFIFATQGGGTLLGPVLPGVCDDVTVEWVVSSAGGAERSVIAGIADPSGAPLMVWKNGIPGSLTGAWVQPYGPWTNVPASACVLPDAAFQEWLGFEVTLEDGILKHPQDKWVECLVPIPLAPDVAYDVEITWAPGAVAGARPEGGGGAWSYYVPFYGEGMWDDFPPGSEFWVTWYGGEAPAPHDVAVPQTFVGLTPLTPTAQDSIPKAFWDDVLTRVPDATWPGVSVSGCYNKFVAGFRWRVAGTRTTPYKRGDIVTVGPAAYQSQRDSNLSVPGTNADWLLISETVGSTPETITITVPVTPGFPDDWRPFLHASGQVTVHSMTVTARPILTLEECVSPYRRTLHNVVTISGPLQIEQIATGPETSLARVEWTWVAAEPHVWHDPVPILAGVSGTTSNAPIYQMPTVQLSGATTVPYGTANPDTGTVCSRPAPSLLSCADNTCCAPLVAPPRAPVLADPCRMNLMGSNMTRRHFSIPEEAAPAGLGILSWVFQNDAKPKLGVHVRIWEDPDPDFGVLTECAFSEEFFIDYLGANQTLHIDGPGQTVEALCGEDAWEQPIIVNALRNVRGNYGGPFHNGVIGCGRRYHVTVDVPQTYTATCSGLYTSGQSQGTLTWSVDLTRRG